MNRFLKATVLACGFAGALTLGFAGCAKQEEDASAVPAPAGLQEELKNESPDGLGRGDRNDILETEGRRRLGKWDGGAPGGCDRHRAAS